MELKISDYDSGSKLINVAEFRDTMYDLRSATAMPANSSSQKKLAYKEGEEIPSDLKPSSEFFRDPTLFSLLLEHLHSQRSQRYEQSPLGRQRDVEESEDVKIDPSMIPSPDASSENDGKQKAARKSQAKDVMPGRLLDEQDEEQGIQQPHVPKKRQYLSSSKMPAILLNAKKSKLGDINSESANLSDNTSNSTSNLNHFRNRPESALSSQDDSASMTPMSADVENVNSPAAGTSTGLALPPTFSRPVTYGLLAGSVEVDEDESSSSSDAEDDEDDEVDSLNEEMEENSFLAPPNNPHIAKTTLETRYLEMANLLDGSQLATLSPQNRLRVNTGQALADNFLLQEESGVKPRFERVCRRVKGCEVVLSVAIYQESHPSRRLQEFSVLGSQNLASLRDAITCGSDIWMEESQSQKSTKKDTRKRMTATHVVKQKQNKRKYPSYFFINQCFYSDTRNDEVKNRANDPCDAIINWAQEDDRSKLPHLVNLKKKEMHLAKFEDLEIRLNYPYLFCHQDVCKHILVFKDIWLLGPRDEIDADAYPLVTFQCKMTRNKCQMCQVWPAEFVTLDDVISGYSPCFFCSRCYGPFHFDKSRKRLWNHQVRTYAL